MRLSLIAFCLASCTLALAAQTKKLQLPSTPPKLAGPEGLQLGAAQESVVKDLPVRKVVLYKNGVGYFEHAGTVNGNQRVAIDFTSPQLNDVLQSLTVLDEGGGHIAGVNYNSTTPLAEQLKSLSLGMSEDPTSTELFQALRGQRVEVTGGPGGTISGRLMSIESRTEKSGGSDSPNTVDKFYLTLVATSGGVRVIELTPALSVRPTDSNLQGQLDRYLELLSTTHSTGLRHLTLNSLGHGERQLRVSYISEVPVWKATYRLVFPREASGSATMQGWAVVDNTVGADWDNVQLALVAGAPQSFIQPLSQPLYARRPEIPIATEAQTTPQTHEAAESEQKDRTEVAAKLFAPPPASAPRPMAKAANQTVTVEGRGFGNGAGISHSSSMGMATNASTGGVFRATDALQEGDISTNAFDDFFEYSLTQPVTILKNESAMVAILQQEFPAEHVTLWSEAEAHPLRAVWLENTTKLTLDSGSFSIFESGEFAGEGLLDPIHPGEKRLLSYAADQAMRIKVATRESKRNLHHVEMRKGAIIETYKDVASVTYTANNSGDVDRMVLLEHPRRNNDWVLDEESKPAETAPNLYRFRLPVSAHATAKLEVHEHGPEIVRVNLNANEDFSSYLIELVKRVPEAKTQLNPIIDAQVKVADLQHQIEQSKKEEQTATADEARDRENLTALKGNDAARRFVDELNHTEDLLQATRKHTADLEQQKSQALDNLNTQISNLSFDWDETVTK
ncbi:hypothetical protein P8935_02475 [Telmatobacter sp. DSM 110680]|uniref:DUF4139 domain-containing protein n=1 Tax=Telmatobacter sp. DSM 110680 TaxID=3036704 RepID=A0AAU7DLG9_9BACT